jgi:hypothetical protein
MDFYSITILIWHLTLSSCRVFEDFSANCYSFVWSVPW